VSLTVRHTETIDVDGRLIRLTNPDRVLWPATGTTKRRLLDFYLEIAPVLLPHVRGRAITLGRWPEGVDRTGWLQAECRGHPEWLPVHETATRRGGRFAYCMVDDRAGLAWLANLGTIELHPFLALAAAPDEPTALVIDLDPGPPAGLLDCARLALVVRDRLVRDGLAPIIKVSGMLGIHVVAPLSPGHDFAATKVYARALASDVARADPEHVTDRMVRSERRGRVYIDWVQNDPSRSTVAAYSPRAAHRPTVSMPVAWSEIERAVSTSDRRALVFTWDEALDRVARFGDLFAAQLEGGGRLPTTPGAASRSRRSGS
jgi:bifunctional non-homologous end joining protein LigD